MTDNKKQIRHQPLIRVFVSSTFSDLKHERDALQEHVFPELEKLCVQNGFQFQAIDLRWGVSSEAGLDHRTMRICFDELRRAREISPRPNFLMLLGDRYGWRPLPEEISIDEFQLLERTAVEVETTIDKTAAEVLQSWYRKDENAVPPVCLLQSRRQNLPDLKDYTQDEPWNEIQAVLWEIINRARPPEQLRGRFDGVVSGSPPPILRFQASATEQEIWHGALQVPDSHEHVLAFFRHINNAGDFPDPTRIKDFFDLQPSGEVDQTIRAEQERLMAALCEVLGKKNVFETRSARLVPVRDTQGRPTAEVTTDHLAQMCSDLAGGLTQIVLGQIEEYWNKTAQDSVGRTARELEIEQDAHERFGRERGGADSFVGRRSELDAIRDYVRSDSRWPLVVHGASGYGKTALLWRAAEEIPKAFQPITRLIGVTPGSSNIRSLLSSLCQELRQRRPREDELPADIEALGKELQEHFRSATLEQPLILFLDALDQLSDPHSGQLLSWIPVGQLPRHVKLVVSCLSDRAIGDLAGRPFDELIRRRITARSSADLDGLSDDEARSSLLSELTRGQIPARNFINLDELSEDEARTLVFDRWMAQAGRAVSGNQRDCIGQRLNTTECRQPLYLKLLFEEAKLWRSYDAAPTLGKSVPAILSQLFERLSQVANHGPLLVDRVLGYLTASRHGLAENEILEVLFADPDYKAALDQSSEKTRHELPARATRIPIAIWSRLRFDLAPYLTDRAAPGANVLTFFHRQVAEWVEAKFVKESDQGWQPHSRLADYFTSCAKGTDPTKEWETDSVRGFAECVYHLTRSGQHERAGELLGNFPFLLHKLRVGQFEGVFEDYELMRREAPAIVAERLDSWTDFLREKAHILRRGNAVWPTHKILMQLAAEHAYDSPITIDAERWISEGRCNWLWLRRVPRLAHLRKNPCLAVLEGHTGNVNGALPLSDGKLLSWSKDQTLRLWDTSSSAALAILKGHTDEVSGAFLVSDGQLLSWSKDGTLRLWDASSGASLAVLSEWHDSRWNAPGVRGALALSDRRVLSWRGYGGKSLSLWEAQSGVLLAVFEGHTEDVNGVMELSDGRLLSWSRDRTLRLWVAQNGSGLLHLSRVTGESKSLTLKGPCEAILKGHRGGVNGALELSDGRLLSWSGGWLDDDKTLRLWDGHSGSCLAVFRGHLGRVNGALMLPDCRLLSWSDDKTLRLWNPHGSLLQTIFRAIWGQAAPAVGAFVVALKGHTGCVTGALALPNGRLLSWSEDSTLRTWDSLSGACLAVCRGHAGKVSGALALQNGRVLSWSEDKTLMTWDAHRGDRLAALKGHTEKVNGALVLPDDRLVSWSEDGTLRLWDGQSEAGPAILEGHSGSVGGPLLVLPDDRLVSWSEDGTLRLWDGQSGACLAVLEGHQRLVWNVRVLADGRLLSWSDDKTLRLWDVQSGACVAVLEGHKGPVNGTRALPGVRLLSWSQDKTLRLWDGHSEACLAVLEGHKGHVYGALALADGRLLSWSQDKMLRLWDGHSGTCMSILEGHTNTVKGAVVLADGRVLSWSYDGTLRLWDGHSGACLAVLAGHAAGVNKAVVLPDGRLLSWSYDKTLRLWDSHSGACLAVLEGHIAEVFDAIVLADGRLLSRSYDKTLRLWDGLTGVCLEVVDADWVASKSPEWLHFILKTRDPHSIAGCCFAVNLGRTAFLRHTSFPAILAAWDAESKVIAHPRLMPDGTIVTGQANGQVCILKLHYGDRRVSVADVEEIFASQTKKAK